MDTLYEVSYLGYNYADPRYHTGIPRVIMAFLEHLAEQQDVSPSFVALQEYIAQLGFEQYIANRGLFSPQDVQRVWHGQRLPESLCRLLAQQFPYRDRGSAADPLYRRALRRLFRATQRRAIRAPVRRPFDVYHSLYFALPHDDA
ncbi:MAG TPA: hypothetical protein VH916_11830, partial [Dehalococcoidia bacterium]